MAERPELIFASSRVSGKHCLWHRAGRNIGNMISGNISKKIVKSDVSLNSEAEQSVELDELLRELTMLARPETREAVKYLTELLGRLEDRRVVRCTFNSMLLKARIELQLDRKQTEHLRIRATNALHLSGSELQIGKDVCFEASLVDDGVILTGVTGLSVQVSVFKGTFRCDVLQARIQVEDGRCRLRLKTRNPLIGQTDDDFSLVDMDADISRGSENAESDAAPEDLSKERKERAKHLRSTYTNMRAFSVSDKLIDTIVPPPATPKAPTTLRGGLRLEYLKNICSLYAVSLVLVACYLVLMNRVPQIVPITMALSAVSLLVLGLERRWTPKSIMVAVALNVVSSLVAIIKLYLPS